MTKINQNFINKLKATGKEESFSLGHKLFLIMSPKGVKVYRYSYRDLETKINKKKISEALMLFLWNLHYK